MISHPDEEAQRFWSYIFNDIKVLYLDSPGLIFQSLKSIVTQETQLSWNIVSIFKDVSFFNSKQETAFVAVYNYAL